MKNCPNCGFDLEVGTKEPQLKFPKPEKKNKNNFLYRSTFPKQKLTEELIEDATLRFPKPKKKLKKKSYSSIKPKGLTLDSALDEAFRLLVKCKAGWKCEFMDCGRKFNIHPDIITAAFPENQENEDYSILDCSHYFRRSEAGTKYELDNAHAFCRTCHTRLEWQKNFGEEYYEFTFNRLGKERFGELSLMSRSIVKIGDQAKRVMLMSMIGSIENLG